MSELAYNQRKVVCQYFECDQLNLERTISMPILGPNLFLEGMTFCKCGFAPKIIELGRDNGKEQSVSSEAQVSSLSQESLPIREVRTTDRA